MSEQSPDYFDIQNNGYAGVDFNQDALTPEAMHQACERMAADGVGGFLATIITEHIDQMALRLSNIVKMRESDPLVKKMVAGFHIEGPFINETPGYRGAHAEDAIHPADMDEMKQLLDAAGGLTRLVTLAPERDLNFEVTRMLAKEGVTVAAGHCDPTLEQLRGAIDAGLSCFTHLGNGCPMQMHRHDNIVQRALSLSDKIWCCFIADGAHVAFFALKNYLRAAGLDRCVVVTDAVPPAGLGPGFYKFGRWALQIGEDMVARAPDGSHLVGAAITMKESKRNLMEKIGLTEAEAMMLLRDNPRKAVGL